MARLEWLVPSAPTSIRPVIYLLGTACRIPQTPHELLQPYVRRSGSLISVRWVENACCTKSLKLSIDRYGILAKTASSFAGLGVETPMGVGPLGYYLQCEDEGVPSFVRSSRCSSCPWRGDAAFVNQSKLMSKPSNNADAMPPLFPLISFPPMLHSRLDNMQRCTRYHYLQ
jgi:hypothetical protein